MMKVDVKPDLSLFYKNWLIAFRAAKLAPKYVTTDMKKFLCEAERVEKADSKCIN